MKYFVIRINKNYTTEYKKNKCVDGWSINKKECWAFSKNGAKNIIQSLHANNKNDIYTYNYIPSDGEGKNE